METEAIKNGCQHGEGLSLMNYQCEECGGKEILWNSRDGVTSFMISCGVKGCDGLMQHIDWNKDEYSPDFLPDKGMRIFIDSTKQIAEVYERTKIKAMWDHDQYPMKERWETPMDALSALMESFEEGQPYVIKI